MISQFYCLAKGKLVNWHVILQGCRLIHATLRTVFAPRGLSQILDLKWNSPCAPFCQVGIGLQDTPTHRLPASDGVVPVLVGTVGLMNAL